MAYTTVAEIYADINAKFPDNTSRLITPAIQRQVLHDIVEYLAAYLMYKPTALALEGGPQQEIELTEEVLAYYGRIPEPIVFFGDPTNGYVQTSVPWSVDLAPPNTTKIIVEIGSDPPEGFIILK